MLTVAEHFIIGHIAHISQNKGEGTHACLLVHFVSGAQQNHSFAHP